MHVMRRSPSNTRTAFFLFALHKTREKKRASTPSRGHAHLDAHVVDDAVVAVPQGRHEELVPEGGPVGPVIEQAHGHVGPRQNPGADLRHLRARRFGPLQKAAVAAQHLVWATAPGKKKG